MAKTADEARKAAMQGSAAYAQANANPVGPNAYTDPANPYVQLLGATDQIEKNNRFQNLYRGLVTQPSALGGANLFTDLQTLLRSTGFSKGKTATGIPDPADIDGLITALGGAIGMNAPDVFSYLSAIAASGGRGTAKEIKQPDTTTKFTRQVTSALQLRDLGDATNKFNDDFFMAYGSMPNQDSIKAFQNAWNAEARQQKASTATETVTKMAKVYDKTSEPIIDKKTGKQKLDKFGQPMFSSQKRNAEGVLQYKPIVSQDTVTMGQGFTAEEQAEFMADYLVANFPDVADADNLGGTAKTIYDAIVKLDQDNYREVSNFAAIAPVIKQVIGSGKAEVAQEYLKQYSDKIRKETGKKYMALTESLAEGQNASDVVKPLLNEISAALETSVDIKDPLAVQMLNFQGPDGTYRLPNELEKNQLYIKDPRFASTSTSINGAINAVQTLRSRLRG
jgi:hypothetical protein